MNSLIGKQLSVYDAAAVLNCGRDSVVRAIRNGKLTAWKLDTGCSGGGGKRGGGNRGGGNITWRIPGEELLDFMKRNSNRN